MMFIRVIAVSGSTAYLAEGDDGKFYVFTLIATYHIALGDLLRGNFDGHDRLQMQVENFTRKCPASVLLECWRATHDEAFERLAKLGGQSNIGEGGVEVMRRFIEELD